MRSTSLVPLRTEVHCALRSKAFRKENICFIYKQSTFLCCHYSSGHESVLKGGKKHDMYELCFNVAVFVRNIAPSSSHLVTLVWEKLQAKSRTRF